jgi:hypothetical protein
VEEQNEGLGPSERSSPEESATSPHPESIHGILDVIGAAVGSRAARAKLIEESTYQLTDLFTIISGRIDILTDKLTGTCRHDLLAMRTAVTKGMQLNNRLLLVARACRRELGS